MRKKAAALKYDMESGKVPQVVAKGRGKIAERIIELAKENGVTIKEDPNLVEMLSTLDIYQEIPESLYKAVAEILAELYKINNKLPQKK